MNILLSDGWRISSDSHNFILQKLITVRKGKNEGKQIWKDVGFYNTLKNLLCALQSKKMLDSDCDTLEELKSIVGRLTEDIEQVQDVIAERMGKWPYR